MLHSGSIRPVTAISKCPPSPSSYLESSRDMDTLDDVSRTGSNVESVNSSPGPGSATPVGVVGTDTSIATSPPTPPSRPRSAPHYLSASRRFLHVPDSPHCSPFAFDQKNLEKSAQIWSGVGSSTSPQSSKTLESEATARVTVATAFGPLNSPPPLPRYFTIPAETISGTPFRIQSRDLFQSTSHLHRFHAHLESQSPTSHSGSDLPVNNLSLSSPTYRSSSPILYPDNDITTFPVESPWQLQRSVVSGHSTPSTIFYRDLVTPPDSPLTRSAYLALDGLSLGRPRADVFHSEAFPEYPSISKDGETTPLRQVASLPGDLLDEVLSSALMSSSATQRRADELDGYVTQKSSPLTVHRRVVTSRKSRKPRCHSSDSLPCDPIRAALPALTPSSVVRTDRERGRTELRTPNAPTERSRREPRKVHVDSSLHERFVLSHFVAPKLGTFRSRAPTYPAGSQELVHIGAHRQRPGVLSTERDSVSYDGPPLPLSSLDAFGAGLFEKTMDRTTTLNRKRNRPARSSITFAPPPR